MSFIVTLVSLTALTVRHAAGQGSGTGLYGLTGPSYQDGPNSLVKYDTETGETDTIVNGDPALDTGENLAALDAVNNIYYILYEENSKEQLVTGLYPFDLKDPSNQIDSVLLPMFSPESFVGAGEAVVSNPKTGNIYIFGHNFTTNEELLVEVSRTSSGDVSTNIVSSYPMINDIPLLSGNPTVYDSKRDTIWICAEYGANETNYTVDYFYFDATNGDILNQVDYTLFPLYTAQYDPNNDVLVGLDVNRRESDGNFSYVLKWVDPVSLEIVKTFNPINEWCTWGPVDTLNIVDDIGYFLIYTNPYGDCTSQNGTLIGHIMSIDINTGELIDAPEFCEFGAVLTCPWDFVYWDES